MNSKSHPAIVIKGARTNNLKNVSLSIPHNKFIVVTGISGSGKSSLVFDIIAQEWQRRYFEFWLRIAKKKHPDLTGRFSV
jgi:excinuclease ABC subunit A